MKQYTLTATALLAALLCAGAAQADDRVPRIVAFSGAIGSQPFASVGGVAVPNDVLGIAPGGRPWELLKLKASVDVNGMLQLRAKGLLLGGGNNIGRPAIPRNMQATLFCNEGGVNNAWNSPAGAVDAQGNFSISGALVPVAPNLAPVPPNPCNLPILLIRNSAAPTTPGGLPVPGAWFAAGIVDAGDD
ncbi:conserved exported hypothetical protein [Rubrivivax sp. A210]|uniref:hypothetical protein n=1 Tax=Rubrivivax sp. A210 TaxID=2772301 RepID=UPI00191A2DF2|nr:hypothetical protein [Rubrivivax sp. A210]CAD5371868.1 conserved exported hypothetical protein [Rubrivivax sp. A210]